MHHGPFFISLKNPNRPWLSDLFQMTPFSGTLGPSEHCSPFLIDPEPGGSWYGGVPESPHCYSRTGGLIGRSSSHPPALWTGDSGWSASWCSGSSAAFGPNTLGPRASPGHREKLPGTHPGLAAGATEQPGLT